MYIYLCSILLEVLCIEKTMISKTSCNAFYIVHLFYITLTQSPWFSNSFVWPFLSNKLVFVCLIVVIHSLLFFMYISRYTSFSNYWKCFICEYKWRHHWCSSRYPIYIYQCSIDNTSYRRLWNKTRGSSTVILQSMLYILELQIIYRALI